MVVLGLKKNLDAGSQLKGRLESKPLAGCRTARGEQELGKSIPTSSEDCYALRF